MKLVELLLQNKSNILNESIELLNCSRLKHYSKDEPNNYKKLESLLNLVIESIEKKNLLEMNNYVENLAKERFDAGYDFLEVHAAFNILEEVVWKFLLASSEKEKLGENLGLISTVLGAGKSTLASTYVNLASKRKVSTLDLSGLFLSE